MRTTISKLIEFLCARGFLFGIRLLGIYLIMPNTTWVMKVYLACYRRANTFLDRIFISQKLNKLHRIKNEILKSGQKGYRRKIDELGLTKDNLDRLKRAARASYEVVVAEIDQDGLYYSYFGPVETIGTISKDNFLKRKKFSLQVVAINGYLGVKKCFGKNRIAFFHEIEALHTLGKFDCNIPAVLDVDFECLTLTMSLILGPVLREKLVEKGAVLRDRDVCNHPEFADLSAYDSALQRVEKAKHILSDTIDTRFIERLFVEVKKIHSAGFLLDDIKYGNIIIERESGHPYFIDFDCARNYSGLNNNAFIFYRDLDIEKFNLHFSTEKPTYKRIKEKIRSGPVDFALTNHMPVYLGAGIRIGPVWKLDSGYGNWQCFQKKYLPSFCGKRALVILPDNYFYSLQMLREGAGEVVGLDTHTGNDDHNYFIQEAYEWADNKIYGYQNIKSDLTDMVKMEIGRFDLILTRYPLYKHGDDSFAIVAEYAKKISDLIVVMYNDDACNNKKSRCTEFPDKPLMTILTTHGFSMVQKPVPLFYGYSPIIARKDNRPY